MNHNQSLLTSPHVGRVILLELSLFGAVKIPLAPSPGTHFLYSPLIDPVTIVCNTRTCYREPGTGSAASYWFMNPAPWCQCNNQDLNVRWWSHFELKQAIKTYCCRESVLLSVKCVKVEIFVYISCVQGQTHFFYFFSFSSNEVKQHLEVNAGPPDKNNLEHSFLLCLIQLGFVPLW